jgi:hypothetical protein
MYILKILQKPLTIWWRPIVVPLLPGARATREIQSEKESKEIYLKKISACTLQMNCSFFATYYIVLSRFFCEYYIEEIGEGIITNKSRALQS